MRYCATCKLQHRMSGIGLARMTSRLASTLPRHSPANAPAPHHAAGPAPVGTAARGVLLAVLLSGAWWLLLAAWAWWET